MNGALYGEALKLLAATPQNRLPTPTASITLDNPLCGDRVTIDVVVREGRIAEVGHAVKGCLLCRAASGAMAAIAPGLTIADGGQMVASVRAMMAGTEPCVPALAPLAPARPHKSRHGCVILPFEALAKAIEGSG